MRSIYILFISILFIGISCKKDELQFFDKSNYIYSALNKDAKNQFYQKSFTFTFDEDNVKESTLELPFKFAGRIAAHDRFFKVEVIDSLSTMVLGENYDWADAHRGVLQGGSQTGTLKIKVYRKEDMKSKTYSLVFKLVGNEEFLPGQKQAIRVEVTDRLIKPDWWAWAHNSYLGPYSATKLKLWLTYMNVLDGTDPWSYPPYYIQSAWGTWNIGEAGPKASVTSFKNWLITKQGNPYDADLEMNVSQSLGNNL